MAFSQGGRCTPMNLDASFPWEDVGVPPEGNYENGFKRLLKRFAFQQAIGGCYQLMGWVALPPKPRQTRRKPSPVGLGKILSRRYHPTS
jgi:hypothetical protein